MADFVGTADDDSQTGTTDEFDSFDFSQGGHDTLTGGGGGEDDYHFGAAFDAGDMVIGTAGTWDYVWLDGDYSRGVTFSAGQLQDVDAVFLDSGTPYKLTLTEGAGGVDGVLRVDTTSTVRLDASAVSQVGIWFVARDNGQRFIGGAGDDLVQILDPEDHSNRLDGGAGSNDELDLQSAGSNIVLHAQDMRNFEILTFEGKVATADGNVAAGHMLQVFAALGAVDFDGHRETDGTFQITGVNENDTLTGGRGADTISGAFGDDVITGGRGSDVLSGYLGADTFVYQATSDSTGRLFDTISDLDGSDLIDLSAIDARTDMAGNQHFKLVDHFDGQSGELTLDYRHKDGVTLLSGDVDGDGKADLVIHLQGDQTGFAGLVL